MENPPDASAAEVLRLQRCINDMLSVLTLPVTWIGRSPADIVHSFLDGLLRVLRLDLAYVRLADETGAQSVHVRVPHGAEPELAQAADRLTALGDDLAKWPRELNLGTGISLTIEPVPLGLHAHLGVVATGSMRSDFPLQTEQLLLNVATNQLLLALQDARLRLQQKRAAAFEEIQRSEHKLRQVLDTIPTIAWCNLPTGPNEYINKAWREYTGLAPEDSYGWSWQSAMHPDDLPALMAKWRELIASGEPGEIEGRFRRHDGIYRWFLIRAEPLRDETGAIARWYGTSTDIDGRKQAEESLSMARAEHENVARAMSLGVLTAAIAHEVNQPITGIVTNASTCLRMLSGQTPNLEGAMETARRTIRDANRAANVISRLRSLYTRKEAQPEPMDLNDAAREVISLSLLELQRNGVVVRQEFAQNLPPVDGDRIQLQQVILNLLRNASDAMKSIEDRPRELVVKTEWHESSGVRLSVSDAGVGFASQSVDKIFEPFYTTKSDGMGIGLSVSRSIIDAHRGRLWAAPNEGPGATFVFSLPAS